MTATQIVVNIAVLVLACAGALQAARRKGRTGNWAFLALILPFMLLVLELLPTRPGPAPKTSNLVLEWVASIVILLWTIAFINGFVPAFIEGYNRTSGLAQ